MIYQKLFFISFLITSCSSINFTSSDIIPVSFKHDTSQTESISVDVEKSFYLWGLLPNKELIEVDKVFEEKGLDEISHVSIKEIKTFKKTLWALLSVGLYYPQTYQISGKVNP